MGLARSTRNMGGNKEREYILGEKGVWRPTIGGPSLYILLSYETVREHGQDRCGGCHLLNVCIMVIIVGLLSALEERVQRGECCYL